MNPGFLKAVYLASAHATAKTCAVACPESGPERREIGGPGAALFKVCRACLFKREHSSMTCPSERKSGAGNNIIKAVYLASAHATAKTCAVACPESGPERREIGGPGAALFKVCRACLFKREHSSMTCPSERKSGAGNNVISVCRGKARAEWRLKAELAGSLYIFFIQPGRFGVIKRKPRPRRAPPACSSTWPTCLMISPTAA